MVKFRSPNTHLQKLELIKEIEKEFEKIEEDKVKLVEETMKAYGDFGPEFAKRVRTLISDMTPKKENKIVKEEKIVQE